MTAQTVKELAQQGDATAIATLLNRSLNPQNITAAVRVQNNCLEILLEAAAQAPQQQIMVDRICKGLIALRVPMQQVKLYGKQTGAAFPDWSHDVVLEALASASTPTASTEISQPNPQEFVATRRSQTPPPSDLPGALATVPSQPQVSQTTQRSQTSGSSKSQSTPNRSPNVVSFRKPSTVSTGLQLKVGSLVLFNIPAKNRRALMLTAMILALQVGAIGLGLTLWGRSAYQSALRKPTTIASTKLDVDTVNPNKVYQTAIKYRHQGIPVIDVTFNNSQTFEMILDTGASGTLITQEMASILQIEPNGWLELGVADGRVVSLPTGLMRSISVDGATVNDVRIVIAPSMPIGLLGHDFFDGFDIKIKQDVVEFYPRQSK